MTPGAYRHRLDPLGRPRSRRGSRWLGSTGSGRDGRGGRQRSRLWSGSKSSATPVGQQPSAPASCWWPPGAGRLATTILLGVGGSATTDGGSGAVLRPSKRAGRLGGARLVVLCDVRYRLRRAPRCGLRPPEGRRSRQGQEAPPHDFNAQAATPAARPDATQPMPGAAAGSRVGCGPLCGAELVAGAGRVDGMPLAATPRRRDHAKGEFDEHSLLGRSSPRWPRARARPGSRAARSSARAQLDAMGARVLDRAGVEAPAPSANCAMPGAGSPRSSEH